MTTGRINQVALPSEPTQPKRDRRNAGKTLRDPNRNTSWGRSPPALPKRRASSRTALPAPLRPNPQGGGSRGRGDVRHRGRGVQGKVGRARARLPQDVPLRSEVVRRGASRFRLAPEGAPPKRGVAYFRSSGFTGGTASRPVTASGRSHRIPSLSNLNVTPRPPPHFASRRSPGLAGGELRKGPGTLSKAMGPTWRSWTPAASGDSPRASPPAKR